jgi:hypothetical protein
MGTEVSKFDRRYTFLNANLVPIFEIGSGEFGSKANSRQVFYSHDEIFSIKTLSMQKNETNPREQRDRSTIPKRLHQNKLEEETQKMIDVKLVRVRYGYHDDIWIFAILYIKKTKTVKGGATLEKWKSPYDVTIGLVEKWRQITGRLIESPDQATLKNKYKRVCDYKLLNKDMMNTLPGSYVKNHIKCADKSSRFTKRARKKKAALAVVGVGGAAAAAAAALKYKDKNQS